MAFLSMASDLTATVDTNNTWDAFVRDLLTGTTSLVSVNREGTSSSIGGLVNSPEISADGRFVTIESGANDLVTADTNGTFDVFVRPVP